MEQNCKACFKSDSKVRFLKDFSCNNDENLEKQRISVLLPRTVIWKGLPWPLKQGITDEGSSS